MLSVTTCQCLQRIYRCCLLLRVSITESSTTRIYRCCLLLRVSVYNAFIDVVCYYVSALLSRLQRIYRCCLLLRVSITESSTTHLSMVLRALLSLAVLERDSELITNVLPSSVLLARDNTELAWLVAFCHLLQVCGTYGQDLSKIPNYSTSCFNQCITSTAKARVCHKCCNAIIG